jgi:hypothetical protein
MWVEFSIAAALGDWRRFHAIDMDISIGTVGMKKSLTSASTPILRTRPSEGFAVQSFQTLFELFPRLNFLIVFFLQCFVLITSMG